MGAAAAGEGGGQDVEPGVHKIVGDPRVTFVGSQTAGANGDVTNVALPGGITVYFSGHDVRHADGARVGVEVLFAPGLDGLRLI